VLHNHSYHDVKILHSLLNSPIQYCTLQVQSSYWIVGLLNYCNLFSSVCCGSLLFRSVNFAHGESEVDKRIACI